MSSTADIEAGVIARRKKRGPQPRRRINLPDGDWLEPRSELASYFGVHERTLKRIPGLDTVTTYVGNVCYVKHNAGVEIVAARRSHPHKRNLPARRRGRR